jgi:PKD repeat protein
MGTQPPRLAWLSRMLSGVTFITPVGPLMLGPRGREDFMRSIGLPALVTGMLVLASACSGNSDITPPPANAAPVASFTLPSCTIGVPCDFASTSTDDAQVTGWSWDFDGDGTADATTANASFTYATAGTFDVSLTVHDAEGLSETKTAALVIAPADPTNTPPTAAFLFTCTAADCNFGSSSTDAAPGSIAAYAWDFGDGTGAIVDNPSHSYSVTAPTDFTVTLTVTDNEGATGVATHTVSVAPAANTAPTADFTHACFGGATCNFTSTSTDAAPGTIATYAWNFGDGTTAAVANPTHVYLISVPTDFTVTLTVTDNQGATGVTTQTFTVSPPPPGAEGCVTSGTQVDCAVNIASRSNIKLKLIGVSCSLRKERVVIPAPSSDQVFLAVCTRAVGDSTKIFGGPLDTPFVYEAGSQARIRFVQGIPDAQHPVLDPPAARVTGTFPNWVMSFEDGADPGAAGEPDFADVVLQVDAIPAP